MFLNLAPDKRVQSLGSDPPPNIPKRGQKKTTHSLCSVDYLPLDDRNVMVNEGDLPINDTKELRDSGISITENR